MGYNDQQPDNDHMEQVFQVIGHDIRHVSLMVSCQGACQAIASFDGNPTLFTEWVRAIETYKYMVQGNENDCILLAYQTSEGPVTSFIQRYREEHRSAIWVLLKK